MTNREPQLPDHDLDRVRDAFQLDHVDSVVYLTHGLMNRNWQIITTNGRYALKQLLDIPVTTARRNLRVLTALHEGGVPVCPPLLTRDSDPVIEVGTRAYCLLPWLDGEHPNGPDLTRTQAQDLGATIGKLHQRLNQLDPSIGLPAITGAPTARTVQPEQAIAEARRFQTAAHAAGGSFDTTVIDLLDQRIALIDKHAHSRPTDNLPKGPYGWTHGDLQHRNIIWTGPTIGAVIDWDRIRVRPFAEEIARTATIQFATANGLDLERVCAFVAGYRTIIRIDDADLADGVHRLWWKRMSDFWLLRTRKLIMRACS
ncbi:phosphotransferase [Phytohabitans kaempferiae]|uniref:Phosphotransferase n=1 Tax=Phytohabitans kaempferiae TaxID=1620943 RepID=A0ABV6MBG9_9ACTN